MEFEEFEKKIRSFSRPIYLREFPQVLVFQDPSEKLHLWVRDINLYALVVLDGSRYKMGFIDLNIRVFTTAPCADAEGETTLLGEVEDLPWPGYRLNYAMSLFPVKCDESGLYGFLSVKFTVPLEWGFFNWAQIAALVIRERAEGYLAEIKNKFGYVDAVEVTK